MIFYFNRHTLWKYCNFIYNAWKIYVFNKKKIRCWYYFILNFRNRIEYFRNSLDLAISKGENFLERFASREFSTIELIARFPSTWRRVELDKDVQIVKEEEGNSCGNSGIAMLISWMRMRVVVDDFECSFWSNKIIHWEGNVVYLLLTIWLKMFCLCKKNEKTFFWYAQFL